MMTAQGFDEAEPAKDFSEAGPAQGAPKPSEEVGQPPGDGDGEKPEGEVREPGTLTEPNFSAIAAAARLICGVPTAHVRRTGEEGDDIVGHAGMTWAGMDERVPSFHTWIVRRRERLEVPDARDDEEFRDDPTVIGEPYLRFYAGTPMIGDFGRVVGTVCVMGDRPHRLSDGQWQVLRHLADSAASMMEAHRYARQSEQLAHGLQDLQELKDQFLRSINHELRTPLTSIRSYLQLIQEGGLDPATERRFLQVIERNSDRILLLIDELLLMASLNARTVSYVPRRENLVAVIRRAIDAVADDVQDRDHTVHLHAPAEAAAWIDARRMQHAVRHLLDNAIKFTPPGGRIDVTVSADPAPRFTVCDTGMGIATTEIERVFESFYRAPAAEEQAIGGTGMGLSIVEKTLQLHGGSVRIDSRPGEGTCVRVSLPIPPEPTAPDSELAPQNRIDETS
ncbi:sensor histidine kinase [Planobispora takensis]|uniref:histidine kinase n=2 Tax=Planobispora takensis TaxID=1367882 RepID=A0A8J3WQD2_9ACTN|nr:sensor histidine kinase [Planobispora takensis]